MQEQRLTDSLNRAIICTLICVAVSMLFGCSSSPRRDSHSIDQMLEREIGDVDRSLALQIMNEARPLSSKAHDHVESEIQRRVWWWLRYYTVRDRERFIRVLKRGEVYRPLVQQILKQYKLPPELYYLAMIESGFVTDATSTASAVGIWQFMRPTALNYGLGVDRHWDERRHPIAATHAAAQYLTYLHRKFNSWYLAIAAYNAGQGRIAEAVRRGRTRDFWVLAERGFLPKETMDYIPKFLAASTIGEHHEEFGFNEIRKSDLFEQWPEIASFDLKLKNRRVRLSDVARQTELSERELLRLNPQLKQALSHSKLKRIRIWVPQDAVAVRNQKLTKNKRVL